MRIVSTFENGMIQDGLEYLSPKGSYVRALHAIYASRDATGFGLVNEEEREEVRQLTGTIKGYSHIEERNQTLFFVYNGRSEIWLFNHSNNDVQFVCADKEFGNCDWGFDGCELLYAEFKQFNECNELHAYWSSDCIFHVVNIDEMLNEKRKQAVIEANDCTYFDVFVATCGPHISAISAKNGGSTLESGVVSFALQFEDNEGHVSNVFDVSQRVVIESENNIGGEPGTTSAKLRIDNLSKKWNNVIIYVIQTVNQITTIKKMPSASYGDSGFTFEYYGQPGEIVDVSTITNKSKVWLRGQDLIQKDGRMFYYNIKNERNLNYQKYANQIIVEYVEFEVSLEQQLKYHFPSLLRGEVYAIAIVWKFLDGTYSHAYHIPGQPSEGSSGTSTAAAQAPAGGGGGVGASGSSSTQYCTDGDGNCVACSYCDNCSACTPTGEGTDGAVASGGDDSIDDRLPDDYNPIKVGDLDTANQYDRKRNPSTPEDRGLESDKFEDAIKTNVGNITTDEQDIIDAAGCHDTLYGCDEAEEAFTEDLGDVFGSVQSNAELLAGMGKDDPDPDVTNTTDLNEAASKLIEDAVTNREYVTQKKPVLNYTASNETPTGEPSGGPEEDLQTEQVIFTQQGVGQTVLDVPSGTRGTIRGDNWVDGLGNPVTEERPRVVSRGRTIPWTSVVDNPDNKDCDGEYFYIQGKTTHHQIPWGSDKPHFRSSQNGVVNKYQPDNYEFSKTHVRPMGFKISNIQFPSQDELPKPLCPVSPFKIVYVKRTDSNKRIFAKGWLQGIFNGSVYGANYAIPRHGVNSFETVDRHIAAGADGNSRKGTHSDDPIYLFHSPDTDCDQSYLPITKIHAELGLLGSGWMHGHYAEGQKPRNPFKGKQVDQRGARLSNNLNHYTTAGAEADILGFSFAPSDSIVSTPPGMDLPLLNRFRASSVYLQTSARMPGDERDKSFIGVALDHFFPTECNAPYVALYREIPDQYGSLDGLKYIDLGLVATQVHAQGTMAIEGLCGDTWIGPYSKKLPSYVSNKKGDFFHPPAKQNGSPCRQRAWCDSGEDVLFEYMGIDHYPTKLPKSGDVQDPKNYAGLHTVAGPCGIYGKSKTAAEAASVGDSESDFYGPGVLKSLVTTIVESHVNPALMQTGSPELGQVYYPKLKSLHLDSDAPNKHPWENSWLNRIYAEIVQPSASQIALKTAIRTLINLIVPAALLDNFTNIEAIIDAAATIGVSGMMMAFWVVAANTLFTDKRLNQLLRISECRRDEEGGDLDNVIKGFEDAYCRYNWDYSAVNDIQSYYAFPLPFNTCDCDSCSKLETNNEIYYSPKQNLDSEIDSYRNVRMNNYNELPSDRGKLQKLFIQNNSLYAHLTDGYAMIRLNNESLSSQIAFQQAGTGEMIGDPIFAMDGVEGGFAGTTHPNAAINTPAGYFFVDEVAKTIYRFNGQPEDIAGYGMRGFFKENLGFCTPVACYDEKTPNGMHYALGWDPRYNRLLLTKQDGSECGSFTISYSPFGGENGGKWVSFHSYRPSGYFWDRNNFYSVEFASGKIFKHHTKNKYMVPFIVEFNAPMTSYDSFTFNSLQLHTRAEKVTGDFKYPVKDLDITFNKMAAWNSTQGTGTRPIEFISDNDGTSRSQLEKIQQDYSKIRLYKSGRVWNSGDIVDLVVGDCREIPLLITDCECGAFPQVNEGLFSCDTHKSQDYRQRKFNDQFITYRYIFDSHSDVRLHLVRHITEDDNPQTNQ